MDEHPDRRDHDEQAGGQRVDVEADVDDEPAGRDPLVEREVETVLAERLRVTERRWDDDHRRDPADRITAATGTALAAFRPNRAWSRRPNRAVKANPAIGSARIARIRVVVAASPYCRIESYSSTSGVRRFRKIAMTIARPTVASPRRDGHHHQGDDRALVAQHRVERPERDDRQVDRVEHQLDRHQHADRVAPGEERRTSRCRTAAPTGRGRSRATRLIVADPPRLARDRAWPGRCHR